MDISKTVSQINKDVKSLEKNVNQINLSQTTKNTVKPTNELSGSIKNVVSETRKATQEMGFFDTNIGKATKSFFTFMSIATVTQTVVNGIKSMVTEVKNLDDSLTELKKVTDLEGNSLDEFTKKAYLKGEQVAKTGNEMIQAATEFAKSGYNPEQSLILGEIALMYTNIADEIISASDSASILIAQMKAFNIEADDSIRIIDVINEVSNNFAVSSGDIARNLGKVSSLWANSGGDLESLVAVMTAGTEITRDAGSMANAIKSLINRIQGMNDEGEKDLEIKAKQEELFQKLNLSLYKQSGELKNVYEILNDLAPVYDELDNAEKGYVTQTLAGVHQSGRLAAILSNWTVAQEALTTAQNASGSAMKENEKVLDSIQGHYQQLQSAFQELATSLINSGLIKGILDFGTGLLKVANSDAVKFIAKVALITTSLSLVVKGVKAVNTAFATYKTYLVAGMLVSQGFSVSQALLIGNNATLTMSFNALTVAMLSNPLFWGTLAVTGILGIIKVIDELNVSYEEQQEIIDNLKQEYEDTKNKVSETETELEKVKNRIEELEKKENLTIIEQEEINKLKEENGLLEKQLAILRETEEIKKKQTAEATLELTKKFDDTPKETRKARREAENIGKSWYNKTYGSVGESNSKTGLYEENANAIKKLNDEIDNLKQKQSELNIETKKGKEEFQKAGKQIEVYQEYVKQLTDENIELANGFSDWIKDLEGGNEETEKFREYLIGLQNQALENIDTTDQTVESNENLSDSLEQTKQKVKEYNEELDNIQEAYKTMEQAVEEYNENGYVTLDTLQALLELDSQYLAQLDLKNGKLSISSVETQNYADNLKYVALASLQAAYAEDMNNLAIGETNALSPLAKSAVSDLGGAMDSAGTIAQAQAGNLFNFAAGIAAIKEANKSEGFDENALKGKIDAISNAYNKAAKNISSLKVGGGITGSGAKSNQKKSKKGSSSAKKEKEWWETELEGLKQQFQYSEITIEEYIGGLEGILARLQVGSEAWKKINEELQKQRLNKLKDDYSSSKITLDEYIASLRNLQKQYKENTEGWKDLNEEINKQQLNKLKDDYSDARISLEQYINGLKQLQRQYKENTASWLDLAKEIKKSLIEQQNEYKSDYEMAYDGVEKLIDNEIDKINELREATEKRYDDEIEAKKKANEETKNEITLLELQERLENAKNEKNKRIWNEALGTWQWVADEKAINEAQKELDDFLFDEEIKKLEETRDAELEALDERIKGWENYKEQWENILSEYQDKLNYQMMLEKLGADSEAKILAQRLDVLQKFRDEYIKIQEEITKLDKMSTNEASGSVNPPVNDNNSNNTPVNSTPTPAPPQNSSYTVKKGDNLTKIAKQFGTTWQKIYELNRAIIGGNPNLIRPGQRLTIPGYSNGGIVDFTGLAMLHGSKSNPEVVMNSTQLSKMFSLINSMPKPNSNFIQPNKTTHNTYKIENITLPNVHNGRDFLNELQKEVNLNR